MAAPSILVVDDQSSNVALLKRTVEREGIRHIPVIFGTVRTTKESKREALSAGAIDDTQPV